MGWGKLSSIAGRVWKIGRVIFESGAGWGQVIFNIGEGIEGGKSSSIRGAVVRGAIKHQ